MNETTQPMTRHDVHYWNALHEAKKAIEEAFEKDGVGLQRVIGKSEIETADDIEALLAFAMKHGDCDGKAMMIRRATEWLQAFNELHENKED